MIWCIFSLIIIGIGILICICCNIDFISEFIGPFVILIGIIALIIFLILIIIYQCDKIPNFETNMVVRENIVYAIEGYEQYGDTLELNRYDVLQKAMDFNKFLTREQAKANSVFFIGLSDIRYKDVELIDYSPLLKAKE